MESGVLYYNENTEKVSCKVAPPTPTIETVDLGLSVNWMTCNVGATSEEEAVLYLQWGDTVGRTADEVVDKPCSWETAPFNGGNSSYNATAFETVSGTACPNGVLASQYDAASAATNGSKNANPSRT